MVRTRATAAVDGRPPPPSVFDIDTTHTADDKHHRQPDTKRRKTTASGTLPESSIAQTKRLGPIKYTCTTCDTDRAASKFPDYNPTPQCDHLINTCKACLKEWIEICVGGGNLPIVPVPKKESETVKDDSDVAMIPDNQVKTVLSVPCPECGAVLNSEDVSRSATTKVFNRFKELNRKHICENTAGWMWCLSPRCNAGQVYVPKMKEEVVGKTGKAKSLWEKAKKAIKLTKPVDAGEPDTMVICHACSAKACGSCVRLWHEGETCVGYQLRVKEHMKEEEQALKALGKYSKKCPGCGVNVQRNGGCPSMHCTKCNTSFCWNCLETTGRNGYCKCHPSAIMPFLQPV